MGDLALSGRRIDSVVLEARAANPFANHRPLADFWRRRGIASMIDHGELRALTARLTEAPNELGNAARILNTGNFNLRTRTRQFFVALLREHETTPEFLGKVIAALEYTSLHGGKYASSEAIEILGNALKHAHLRQAVCSAIENILCHGDQRIKTRVLEETVGKLGPDTSLPLKQLIQAEVSNADARIQSLARRTLDHIEQAA